MSFSSIATEIRLKIFSELLVLSEPIDFVADYGPPSPPLFRRQRDGLCPAVLRVSSMMYREASPLLYTNNRFRFPEVFTSTPSAPTSAYIGPFLDQIGSHARAILHEAHIKNLELIRDTCAGIQTLELLVLPEHYNYALSHSTIAVEALNLLDTRLKSIPPLKDLIINFQVYPEEDPSDDLTKKIHDYGWTVKVTKLPKKIWISYDDRVEFDNEEDCDAYDNEQFRREQEEEEEKENESWLAEYDRRRRDPYWKNDSDSD
ncbi:hypothetical protein MMC32_007820 [Xylographa parallela]|nr:hypothetical protein [Xylographa parallela]